MNATIQTVIDAWITAERQNDTHALADGLAADFQFVGPAGFVLNKQQFLGRFDSGDLKTTSFAITNLNLRQRQHLAMVIGVWTQETTFQGRPNNGNFRMTLVLTGNDTQWQVLGAQLSPMMGPPA